MSSSSGPSSDDAPHDDERESITWSIHSATREEDQERAQDEARSEIDGSSSSDASDEDRHPRHRHTRRRSAATARDRALTDDHALRLAHAMAHNPVDALLPSPPRSPPRSIPNPYDPFGGRSATVAATRSTAPNRTRIPVRIVTVNDVKNRTCWICSDGDADEAASDPSRSSTSSATSSRRRWLHPCKCSLMAHEDCLLTWIRTTRASDRNKTVACPQCAHPYNIVEYKPRLLRLFEASNALINDAVVYTSISAGACTVYLTVTAYGIAAFRAFMGKEASTRAFGRGWPWHYYLELPCIPILLVLSRIQPLDHVVINWMAWIPIMMMFPTLTQAQGAAPGFRGRSLGGRASAAWMHQPALHHFGVLSTRRPWPPGPIRLFFLLPWVRAVYAMVKRNITRRVLAPYARRRQQAGNGSNDARLRRNTRVIVVGEAAPAETLDDDGTVNVDENGLPRDLPPGVEAIENQETIYVSPQSLARLCCTTLSAPFVAKYMGNLLARLARHSDFFRRFLGLQRPLTLGISPSSTLDGSTSSLSKSSSRPSPYSTPLANLLSTGSFKADNDPHTQSSAPLRRSYSHEPNEAWLEPSTAEYDDLDPAWFRNAIGLGLFVVVKDAVQLAYRYLRLEHARQASKRTKIVDRPFVGGVVEQLELRD